MDLFQRIQRRRHRFHQARTSDSVDRTATWLRRCRFEQMEARQLLAVDILPIDVGMVYREGSGGDDLIGDTFEITFAGGAPGTQLTEFVIETDKDSDGIRDEGECFFDTKPGGAGDFGSVDIEILEHQGFDVVGIFVEDGGDTLRITLAGFEAGETLFISIDVDEQGYSSANSVAEGNEFEGSRLVATFEVAHYEVATGMDIFIDAYNGKLQASGLDLPPDNYVAPPATPEPVLTAGAIFVVQQTPLPITLSGTVFEDNDLDLVQDAGEPGLGGVRLTLYELVDGQYVARGTGTTDTSGNYEFTDLLPGTYRVVETQPSEYLSVGATAGTVDGQTRGTVQSVDVLTGITLAGGEDSIDNDFAEVRPASLSGHVYHDADNDGVFDGNEDGIQNVLVRVTSVDTLAVIDVHTTANGYWSVGNLMPGQYSVTEVTPDGYLDGIDAAGTVGGIAHNPGDLIDGIVLAAGDAAKNYDFGELMPGGLCGYVYVDADNDGIRDAGEIGIPGVELVLLNAAGKPTGRSATTDKDGHYCFADLKPGTYGIKETHPDGYADGTDTPGTLGGVAHNPGDLIDTIVVGSGQKGMENNFGELEMAGISGYVYADDNNNGVKDPGEAGIAGAQLELLDALGNPTGMLTTTGTGGYYEFLDLLPGTYGVAEAQPAGYYDGRDTAGDAGGEAHNPGDAITGAVLGGGMVAENYNFGELQPVRIQGTVFIDLDGDCMPDKGETRLPGVTVYLLDDGGKRIESIKTDQNGEYRFAPLMPGTYGVEEIQPSAYLDGNERVGSAGGEIVANDVMMKIELGPGEKGVDYNFCEVLPATISGYVFQDGPTVRLMWYEETPPVSSISDGKFTSDDTPIAGVVLKLCTASGEQMIAPNGKPITTTTNAAGYYEFTGLAPDTYTIFEVQPAGYVDGIDSAGSLGGIPVNGGAQIDPVALGSLTRTHGDDAILGIVVTSGDDGMQYNFSEVRFQRIPFTPNPDPDPRPDPIPKPITPGYPKSTYVPYVAPAPYMPNSLPFSGGSGMPLDYTWHLSVINAGQPRRMRDTADNVAVQWNTHFNPVSWAGSSVNEGQWVVADQQGMAEHYFHFGVEKGLPVVGDFNGDGVDEIGVFIDGQWFIDVNGNGVWDDGDLWAMLGTDGDLPVTGDWDGDGKTDIGIFGQAWIGDPTALQAEAGLPDNQNEPNGGYKNLPPDPQQASDQLRTMKKTAEGRLRADLIDHVFRFGAASDRPVAGDWNGDGVATVGVFRNGIWYLDVDGNGRWSSADREFAFGARGDIPVAGDFNHDGIDDVGVFRAGKWYLDTNGNHQLDAQDKVFALGAAGDSPIVGDFDGDGVDQIGVYRGGSAPDRQAMQATTERR